MQLIPGFRARRSVREPLECRIGIRLEPRGVPLWIAERRELGGRTGHFR